MVDAACMTDKFKPCVMGPAEGNDFVVSEGFVPRKQVVAVGVHVRAAGQKVTVYQKKPAAGK